MNGLQSPSFPATADTPGGQRTLTGLRDLIRSLVGSGAFLQRPSIEAVIIPRVGAQSALLWGSMNRVMLLQASTIQLPPIRPEMVGVPLEFVLITAAFTLTVAPSGYGLDRKTRPQINGATTKTYAAAGLFVLKTDGQNWFGAP